MGLFGGSSSSSTSSTNSISFNPVLNIGDGNSAENESSQRSDTSSSATAKDEFGLSASVGVAVGGGTASGGPASLMRSGDDVQPILKNGDGSAFFDKNKSTIFIVGGVALVAAVGLYFVKKK